MFPSCSTLPAGPPRRAAPGASELLDYLEVGHRAPVKPALLSGGEAQRVAIARALANSPRIILADEPTAALDSKRAQLVMDLMRKLAVEQEACIITVTHDEKDLRPLRPVDPSARRPADGHLKRNGHDQAIPFPCHRAAVAVLFGLLTVVSGGRALFAGVDMGAVVPFVLWFNFTAGFAYIAAGIGLWRGVDWAPALSLVIAVATGAVFVAFLGHVWKGGAFEARTMGAMSVRLLIWTVIAWLAARTRNRPSRR